MKEDKEKKYDRQLRIWGGHGQAALENATVCLLNSGPTGSESLKNLVLGGIAGYTIVDAAIVQNSDLGNNFMLDAQSVGQSKAKCVCDMLQELNPSVAGKFVEEDPHTLLTSNPSFFDTYTLVIATQVSEQYGIELDKYCRSKGVKLIVVRSYGLTGYLRLSVEEHRVVESKPDTKVDDLRLHAPWPALLEYANSFRLEDLDDRTHKHVPWGVLLLLAAQTYSNSHGGALPKTYPERNECKDIIRQMRRGLDEENIDEALANVHRIWAPPSLSSELKALLEDPATEITSTSDDFWVLVRALKLFLQESGGMLPLEGSLPDMTATTDYYIELQDIYRAKAEEDIAGLSAIVANVLREAGVPEKIIPEAYIKLFCKNAAFIQSFRYRTLEEEYRVSTERGASIMQNLSMEDRTTNTALYVLLSAVDHYKSKYGDYPGVHDDDVAEDMVKLKQVVNGIMTDNGASNALIPDDLMAEMCRYGACELHVVGAVMGGMAAQEAIKLITSQFLPFSGTLIYNAMNSTTSVL